MESIASSSTTHTTHHHRFNPTQPFEDRVQRALRHHLRLLHRSDTNFFILGATGNVYTVTLSLTPSCTCPDSKTPCKHILFVLIRVLGVSLDDSCLWKETLRQCQIHRLLNLPMSPETFAGDNVRRRFHELFLQSSSVHVGEGSTCPVCLEEMGKGEKVVECGTCRNPIHDECLLAWKKSSRRRRLVSCVLCRARWRDRAEQETYLNLSAYVSEDNIMVVEGEGDLDIPRCTD